MIRKIIAASQPPKSVRAPGRNYEVQRIETFSDAVFAFAVTLLIVSLEVPKNFEELMTTMRGFFAFGISFVLLVIIWNEQHVFFRKFGLHDSLTLVLNICLLFIVLFYVYPLKFLFTLLFHDQIYGNHSPVQITGEQAADLMKIYASGYIAIYLLFLGMYLHARSKASELELTNLERFTCNTAIYKQLIMVVVGCTSFALACLLPLQYFWISGVAYMIIAPVLTIFFTIRAKKSLRFR